MLHIFVFMFFRVVIYTKRKCLDFKISLTSKSTNYIIRILETTKQKCLGITSFSHHTKGDNCVMWRICKSETGSRFTSRLFLGYIYFSRSPQAARASSIIQIQVALENCGSFNMATKAISVNSFENAIRPGKQFKEGTTVCCFML